MIDGKPGYFFVQGDLYKHRDEYEMRKAYVGFFSTTLKADAVLFEGYMRSGIAGKKDSRVYGVIKELV
jgi:hypothetical protein